MFGIDDMLLGGIVSAAGSFFGGESRNKAQAEQAYAQQEFQRYMSNTAHQREVEDLRLAGLNPMLSLKSGGASTPPGAQAQMQDTVTPAINTGVAAATARANIANLEEQNSKIKAETDMSRAQARKLDSETMLNFTNVATSQALEQLHGASASELRNREMLQNEQKVRLSSQSESDAVQRALWRAQTNRTMGQDDRERLDFFYRTQDWPKIFAENQAWSSQFGQKVMPFAPSINLLGSSAANFGRLFRGFPR